MTSYAVAHLHNVETGSDILAYLEAIDAMLAPFGGRFVIHGGGDREQLEGAWPGDLIVIGFPDRIVARAWGRPLPIRRSCRYAPGTPKATSS